MTRDQQRASLAFEHVERFVKQHAEEAHKRYGSMCHKLPVLIRSAGLVQAIHFLDARGKEEQKELLSHLAEQLDRAGVLARSDDKEELLSRAREAGTREYMWLTRESLAALLWYKRLAQSRLGVEAGEEESDEGGESA